MNYTKQCGCKIYVDDTAIEIMELEYCPMHEAAPDMQKALKEADQHLIMAGVPPDSYARRNIKQVLAKAEVKK